MARVSRKQEKLPQAPLACKIKAALYARLSNEDNGGRGKDSIENQMELLKGFAEKLGEKESVKVYIDNGQTGTDFERPEWEQVMEDVREQKINCIIVKDLSRFGRNYLEAGQLLEKIFPFLGVRFIAVNDCYDSASLLFPEKDLAVELKNLMNDFYSKDISQKVMSAFRAKKGRGEYIGNKAPYGYVLKENHFRIDEAAACIVRRIFAMKMQGISSYEIAGILNREGIPSPSRYAQECGMKKYRGSGNMLWQPQAVNRILYNRVYTGDLVQGKYNRSIYSRENQGIRAEEAWEVTKDAHEAIIDRELFRQVQEIKAVNRENWRSRQGNAAYGNVLEGILVCGICGHPMRRNKEIRRGRVRYYFYCASAYHNSQVQCNTSSIADDRVFEVVLRQIKLQALLAVEMDSLIGKMKKSRIFLSRQEQKREKAEQTKKELEKYVYLKTGLYENMKAGILTKQEFLDTKESYSLRILHLKQELEGQERELKEDGLESSYENRWLKAFSKFADAEELTRDMAMELLDRVEIFPDKRMNIRFKFRNEYEYLMSKVEEGQKEGSSV